MNVPPATLLHRARAWWRLRRGPSERTVIVWIVAGPGDETGPWGVEAPAAFPLREEALALAEKLAASRPALVFFVGPEPTRWEDLYDVAEVFREAGAALVLATPPARLNPMSAPVYAYHFTRIYLLIRPDTGDDDPARIRRLTDLRPRGPVEARVFGAITPELRKHLYEAGVDRVLRWPPENSTMVLCVAPNLETGVRSSVWPSDHVWEPRSANPG